MALTYNSVRRDQGLLLVETQEESPADELALEKLSGVAN